MPPDADAPDSRFAPTIPAPPRTPSGCYGATVATVAWTGAVPLAAAPGVNHDADTVAPPARVSRGQ